MYVPDLKFHFLLKASVTALTNIGATYLFAATQGCESEYISGFPVF
jgi:hypothetical protein